MKKNGILFRVASGLLAAALTVSLTACGGSSSNSDASAAADSADSGATHLRLIYSPSLCAAPMYIAIENGYFEDEGLDIEQVTVDAAHVSEAIGADQVDVGMGLIGKLLQPLENGLPIKFTTGIHTGCTKLLVPGDSDIKSIADLKGKKIGVPGLADAATVVSKRSLSAAGIGVTDQNMEVEFSVYSRNDLAQALQNGAVDAIALGDPAASIAEEQYGLTALIDTATDPEYKDEYCCAAFVTSKLAEENPKAAAAFTRAVQKASQWVQENPDETAKIITEKEYVSGDADFCAQILKTYNYKPSVQGGYDALKQNAEELTQIGVLKEGTDATKFADNAYIFFDDVPDAPESDASTDTATKSTKASCSRLGCRSASEEQYPPFCLTTNVDKALLEETLEIYRNDPEQGLIARTSACIEGEFYGRLTRVEETIEFIKRMGYKKIGIASCVGLMREASIFARILKAKGIEYFTVGCKVGAQDKTEIGVPNEKKLNGGCGHESMCNPIMQAKTLAAHGCDFNIVIGLCVGHDTLFLRHSKVPTTVMIVKDRVLQHNPVAALYGVQSMYSRFKDLGL